MYSIPMGEILQSQHFMLMYMIMFYLLCIVLAVCEHLTRVQRHVRIFTSAVVVMDQFNILIFFVCSDVFFVALWYTGVIALTKR